MATKLYIGSLPYATSSADLAAFFGRFGQVESADVIVDKFSGRSKGFGFVTFADDQQAAMAVEMAHGSELDGRVLVVNVAKPLAPRLLRRWDGGDSQADEQTADLLAYRLAHLPVNRHFGHVSLPHVGESPGSELLVANLQLPQEYSRRLITVEHLPLKVFQLIASDPRSMHTLTPRQFEEFIAELVAKLGFDDVLLTSQSRDGGRDVIARKRVHGIPITFFFECKKYAEENPVQLDTLRALLGVVAHGATEANKGVLVTTSRFTSGCKELIANECRLDGKDYDGIVDWLDEYKQRSQPQV